MFFKDNNIELKHFLLLIFLPILFYTDATAQRKVAGALKLKWNQEIISETGENESVKLLNFEGAIYDGTALSLPYFTELVPYGFIGYSPVVTLNNAQYEPFTTTAFIDFKKIGSEPFVEAKIFTERKVELIGITVLPIRKNSATGALERLVSFSLDVNPGAPLKLAFAGTNAQTFAPNSVLASGTWFKMAINTTGIQLVSANLLRQLGMTPSNVNPSRLRIFGNGTGLLPFLNSAPRHDDLSENAIFVSDLGVPGVFDETDFVLFFAQGPTSWNFDSSDNRYHHTPHLYSDNTYYFITPDLNIASAPKRIQYQPSSPLPATYITSTFDDYQAHEIDRINFIKSGRQWYGEQFDVALTQTFSFTFPDIDVTVPAYVKSNLVARSFVASYFKMNYGNQLVLQQNVAAVGSSYTSDFAAENVNSATFNAVAPSIPLALTYYPSTSTAVGFLNYLEMNVRRNLNFSGSQMMFRDKMTIGTGNISTFNLSAPSNVLVWDITDHANVKFQQFSSGTTFTLPTDSLKEFIAYDGSSFLNPIAAGSIYNQNLHSLGSTDMVIVSNILFLTEAVRLANFHRTHNNMKVVVVTPEQVYNEFSSGARDITALRTFLKMFYDRANSAAEMPKYFMLFGDGSYDNKGSSASNTNFLPTYESLNSISLVGSYVSDDFYGFLDDNEGDWDDATPDLLDVGIGRLPVKTMAEATTVVNKIIDYATPGTFTNTTLCVGENTTSLGDWRNTICFVADDEDSGLHLDQANNLATYLKANKPDYNIDKIFIDAYVQLSTPGGQRYPTVNEAITRRIEKGTLVMNYTGHGGETGWTGERILDNNMIQSWKNIRKLPLFITATCEFSRYDDPARTSSGELVLINSEAGGIALMTTTRLVYASQNAVLNDAMIRKLFEPINGENPHLGEIYMLVKNDNNVLQGGINPRNFSLLGDPALVLAYPKYDVITTQINGTPVNINTDTLTALSKVTISGEIRSNGQKLTNFNGLVYPTVFDKAENVSTLSNDPSSPLRIFSLQKNILYKGKASVKNGDFTYTFIVPKDIAYEIGKGRLSYYAHNGVEDANGYYDSLLIGGSSTNAVTDITGPGVKLFMNDEKFIFGGTTDENPKIYALVTDSNGINTVGNGIGHDITAQLDNNTEQIYVLNDYYEANLDSYQAGRILYPLENLSEGHHEIKFKIWDIYNNSSESKTEFVVAESAVLALNHVLNYPNPFTTKTSFFFEHNHPCNMLDVQVQIFTVSGKLIKTISRSVSGEGYRVDDVTWDGRDDFGDNIGRGVYVYRLKIRDSDGATAEKYEKLVILK